MTNIQKVLTSHFGSLEIDVVQAAGQPEPGITRRQLGEMLGYENPSLAIKDIHTRNADRFNDGAKCAIVKMPDTAGRYVDTYIYGFKGILEVCRYSNQPNANAVMDWAWETLDRLRKDEISTRPLTGNELVLAAMQHLQSELGKEKELRLTAEARIEADKPKVLFADSVSVSKSEILVGELAKILHQNGIEIGQNRLFERLRNEGYLCKTGTARNTPTQRAQEMGLFRIKETAVTHSDGHVTTSLTTKVTGNSDVNRAAIVR